MAKYLLLHSLLDRRNAFSAAFAAFAELRSLILTVADRLNVEARMEKTAGSTQPDRGGQLLIPLPLI